MKDTRKKRTIKIAVLIIIIITLCAAVSVITSYFIINRQGYIRFVSEPRKNNPDYGYLEVAGNKYYQLYTTTEVKDSTVPLGSHYHRIDLRSTSFSF